MYNNLSRANLIHRYPGMKLEAFLQDIFNTGGWPYEYNYVQFYHAIKNEDRYCRFTNDSTNTPFWTTVCHMDEFLEFLMSGEKIFEIEKRGIKRVMDRIARIPIEE